MKAYDLVLLFLQKKNCFLFWVWPIGTPFLHKLGQKIVIFKGFSNFFSELPTGFQLKLLILIESPKIFHWKPAKKKLKWLWSWGKIWAKTGPILWKNKETGIMNRSFLYLTWRIPFKVKGSVVHTPEWKFKANISGNVTFEWHLGPNFFLIRVKYWQKTDYF